MNPDTIEVESDNNQEDTTSIKRNIQFLKNPTDKDLDSFALQIYESEKIDVSYEDLYKYFLWSNFYFSYNTPKNVKLPLWITTILMIDANPEEISEFMFLPYNNNIVRAISSSSVFNDRTTTVSDTTLIYFPYKNMYSDYTSSNYNHSFSKFNHSYKSNVLAIQFLKNKYGTNIVRELISWSIKTRNNNLLLISFIKDVKKQNITLEKLNSEFEEWVDKNLK